MKLFLQFGLCCLLASGAFAQRGGVGGSGSRGGGSVGGSRGIGAPGAGFRGGAGFGNGFRGNFRGGFNKAFRGGFGAYYSPYLYGYPWFGSYDYRGLYDPSPYIGGATYGAPYEYNPSPNVTVIYAQPSVPPPAPEPPPVSTTHAYDQYGQELNSERAASRNVAPSTDAPAIYLLALKDHTIYAADAYWVDGKTLHYVTLQHQEKQIPLDQVDRPFSGQLNRERRVAFHLPAE